MSFDNLFDVPLVGGTNLYPSSGAVLFPYRRPEVAEHLFLAVGDKDMTFDNLTDVPSVDGTNLKPLIGTVDF